MVNKGSFVLHNRYHDCLWSGGSRSHCITWWRHQMDIFFTLLALCEGNSPVNGELPAQWSVTRSFEAFFHLRLNKRLSKQWWGWWSETPSRSLWRHCNEQPWYWSSIYGTTWSHHQKRQFIVPMGTVLAMLKKAFANTFLMLRIFRRLGIISNVFRVKANDTLSTNRVKINKSYWYF